MLASVASSTTAAACSTPRSGSPVAVAAATSAVRRFGLGDVAALDLRCRRPSPGCARWPLGCLRSAAERDVSTIRPQPAAAIFAARNRPRPPRPPVMM